MKTNAWLTEGNYKQWIRNGLLCEIRRAKESGQLNGYVGLHKKHPLIGLTYEELYKKIPDLYVHGGLTFSTKFPENTLFPKLQKPWRPNQMTWTYGFDCAHLGDYCPELDKTLTKVMGTTKHSMSQDINTYRNMDYVRNQVNNLCDILANYERKLNV